MSGEVSGDIMRPDLYVQTVPANSRAPSLTASAEDIGSGLFHDGTWMTPEDLRHVPLGDGTIHAHTHPKEENNI